MVWPAFERGDTTASSMIPLCNVMSYHLRRKNTRRYYAQKTAGSRCLELVILSIFILPLLLGVEGDGGNNDRTNYQGDKHPQQRLGSFVWLTDVHLDAYYGTPQAMTHKPDAPCANANAPQFSYYRCGSNEALLNSALDAASATTNGQPDFVLFTGDATRHWSKAIYQNNNLTTNITVQQEAISKIPKAIQQHFPKVPILELPMLDLGNNDFEDDYFLPVSSDVACLQGADGSLPPSSNAWLSSIALRNAQSFASELEAATFSCGGYYRREVQPGLHVIILNTVVWSIFHHPILDDKIDPLGQHAWLKAQLEEITERGEHAFITGHIPPVLQSYVLKAGTPLMQAHHVIRYLELIERFQSTIGAQLFGHVHSNELRAMPTSSNDAPPIIMSGSISPCYGSKPVFQVGYYDLVTKHIWDIASYNANLGDMNDPDTLPRTSLDWKPVFPKNSLRAHLGMKDFSNEAVRDLAIRLSDPTTQHVHISYMEDLDATWDAYFNTWYQGNRQPDCRCNCRRKESCLVSCGFDAQIFNDCVENTKSATCTIPTMLESDTCKKSSASRSGVLRLVCASTFTMCFLLVSF
jgi:hypothetical protein